jgi:thioredoxin-like negative regulator of GroEL
MRYLALTLSRAGELDEAESLAREALAIKSRIHNEGDLRIAEVKITVAECLTRNGKFVEAETLLLEGFPKIREVRGDDHVFTIEARDTFVALYEAWGKPEEAGKYRAMLRQQPSSDDGRP